MLMITAHDIHKVVWGYKPDNIHIGVLGSHSAVALGRAAKAFGAKTLLVAQAGRDELYVKYNSHLYDHVISVDDFKQILEPKVQAELLEHNTIWVPHRSFTVYVGVDGIENQFSVPIYGNRAMLRTEDRNDPRNQYYFLGKAGIKYPKYYETPDQIDGPVIVKVQRADKPLERTFFVATSPEDYYAQVKAYRKVGLIDDAVLRKSRIEAYVLGAKVNANFHGYAMKDLFGDLDLVGFSGRRQVNLQGFLDLPAREQLKLDVLPNNEEVGHYGITVRESFLSMFYRAAERFMRVVEEEAPPGMIGSFGLQGALAYGPDGRTMEFVVFDVSPRIPGDPAIGPTSPEMRGLTLKYRNLLNHVYGGERIEDPLDLTVLEIMEAAKIGRLHEVVS